MGFGALGFWGLGFRALGFRGIGFGVSGLWSFTGWVSMDSIRFWPLSGLVKASIRFPSVATSKTNPKP